MQKKRTSHKQNSLLDSGMKTCFLTRETCPRQEMLRFVCSPDRAIVFDVSEKLPGRGFWLKADIQLVKKAIQQKTFLKLAGASIQVDENLPDIVGRLLKEKCLTLMALCRKAGLFVFGYEGVKKAVGQQQAIIAFEALEASERGQSKIFRPDDTFPIYSFFSKEEMGRIAGLNEVVHVALLPGKLSDEVAQISKKMSLYMADKRGKDKQ